MVEHFGGGAGGADDSGLFDEPGRKMTVGKMMLKPLGPKQGAVDLRAR